MNMKTTVPLAVSVVLGLVAAIVASQLVKQHPAVAALPGQAAVQNLSEVVVAARDVAPGAALTSEDLKVLRIESGTVPGGISSNASALFGRVAKVQIPAGQMVHNSMLAERGVAAGLPGVIPPGLRAMTVEVNEFTGVAGLLEPGNHVDILARVAEAEGAGQMTRTIVQNVPILAVGSSLTNKQAVGTDADKAAAPVLPDAPQAQKAMARSLTLLVTPEDAEKIDLASASNGARIVLRASTDSATAKATGATLAILRGNASTAGRPGLEPPTVTAANRKAALPRNPADDVFGPPVKDAFKPRGNSRSITVIRAGAVTQVEVEDPAKPDGVDDDNATAGGGDLMSPR